MDAIQIKVSGFCMKKVAGKKTVGSDTIRINGTRGAFGGLGSSKFQVLIEDSAGANNMHITGGLGFVKETLDKKKLGGRDLLRLVAAIVGEARRSQLASWFSKREILVLNALADSPKTAAQLAEQTGLSRRSAIRGVFELRSNSFVEIVSKDSNEFTYGITNPGKNALAILRREGPEPR